MTQRMRDAYKSDLEDWIKEKNQEIFKEMDTIIFETSILQELHEEDCHGFGTDRCIKNISEACAKIFEHQKSIKQYESFKDILEKYRYYVAPDITEHLKCVFDVDAEDVDD